MLRKIRSFAICGLALIAVWSCITYFSPSSSSKDDIRHDDRCNEQLFDKLRVDIEALAVDVKFQAEESEKMKKIMVDYEKRSKGGNISTGTSDITDDYLKSQIAILVFSCNRTVAVRNHLDQLLKLRPSEEQFPVVVSQDCAHEETANAIRSYGNKVHFMQHPDQSDIELPPKPRKLIGYYKISRHYRWAINQTFFKLGYENVIITEDDLDISVDFFEYFLAGFRLMKQDPTIWCVSAWNDNGRVERIEDKPDLLYRSDFFSGLGWLLMKNIYLEMEPNWPIAFWDDWMREPVNRKERACIRPEISRTSMTSFGKAGVSKGSYYEKYLKFVKLNSEFVPFTKMNLTYLLKDKYDEQFVKTVYSSPAVSLEELKYFRLENGQAMPSRIRLTYSNQKVYKNLAKSLKIMEDSKAGVPRTAYRGIVPLMFNNIRVYLSPESNWTRYDTRK